MVVNTEDIVGTKIGCFTVRRYVGKRPSKKYRFANWDEHTLYHKYSVKCDCGERQILKRDYLLKRKKSKYCKVCEKTNRTINKKKVSTSTYETWYRMKTRCCSSKINSYTKNNIKFCKRWFNYRNFLKDMGKKKEKERLVRIDKSKNFCKSNCKWDTYQGDANRRKNCYKIRINGKKNSLRYWFKHFGFTVNQYNYYLRKGYKKKSLREKFNLKDTDTCSLLIRLWKKY